MFFAFDGAESLASRSSSFPSFLLSSSMLHQISPLHPAHRRGGSQVHFPEKEKAEGEDAAAAAAAGKVPRPPTSSEKTHISFFLTPFGSV